MLGAFVAVTQLPFSRHRYVAHRRRIQEFLREINIEIALPGTQAAFAKRFDGLLSAILAAVRQRSDTLHDFAGLGVMAVLQGATGALVTKDHLKILRARWAPVLDNHGVSRLVYEDWLRALPRRRRNIDAEAVLSLSSGLLTAMLEPLDAESDTCFVAMPFRAPFTENYSIFYRPSLERSGFRAIRAWGSLSSEEYYLLLLTLISHSGGVLADLTSLNLNVVNEVGIAHGVPRVVFIIGQRSLSALPSNIAHLPNFTYSPRGKNWTSREIERCGKFIGWVYSDYQRRRS